MASSNDVERGVVTLQEVEIELPSIQPKKTATLDASGEVDDNGVDSSTGGRPWMAYLTTSVALCGAYEFGACAGYSSPTQSKIISDFRLSTAQFSLFGSLLTFGAMIGGVTSGPIADFIGRKWAMRVYATFCAAGWLAIYFSKGLLALDAGRLAGGYGIGAFSYVVPIYIAEIAPVNLRGALTSLNNLMLSAGISAAFLLGMILSWRTLALTGIIPCGVLLFGLFFIPESPRWLAKREADKEFNAALEKLRGKRANIRNEAAEIKGCLDELEQQPKASFFDLFRRRYIRCFSLGVGLMVCNQLGGVNGICFYASNIFHMAGFSSRVGTVLYAVLQIIFTAVGAALIDRLGRKPLMLFSATGLVLGCLLTALAFLLKAHEASEQTTGMLAAAGILVYIASYSTGIGPVPWVVMSEIFPMNIKGVAGSLATLVNWFIAWAVSYSFNFLMKWSSYGTFILFAAINALAIIFVIKVVPETKGKTLEQIQASIND